MSALYLLTESVNDDAIYIALIERMCARKFTSSSLNLRKGAGLGNVRSQLKLTLNRLKRFEEGSDAHFLIAVDNDRAPHPSVESMAGKHRLKLPKADQKKVNRYEELSALLYDCLGPHKSQWKVRGAIAVPVEMVESWLLLIARGGSASELPRFSVRTSPQAACFFPSGKVPPQLKDCAEAAMSENGYTDKVEWALHLITDVLDPVDLARRSHSFAMFVEWLREWR